MPPGYLPVRVSYLTNAVTSKIILDSCGCGCIALRSPANLCRRDGLYLESAALVRKICFLIKQVGKMHSDVSPKKSSFRIQDIWFQLYGLGP